MLKSKGVRQPVLFEINRQFFLKADDTVMNEANCSYFTDAVEFFFMSFFIFNVEYEHQLHVFFGKVSRYFPRP